MLMSDDPYPDLAPLARPLASAPSKCWWGSRQFDVYSAGTTAPWPWGGGVYIFARPEPRGPEPVYIGETESFATRLVSSHEKVPVAGFYGAAEIHVWSMPSSTGRERRALERELREQFQPVMNPASGVVWFA